MLFLESVECVDALGELSAWVLVTSYNDVKLVVLLGRRYLLVVELLFHDSLCLLSLGQLLCHSDFHVRLSGVDSFAFT